MSREVVESADLPVVCSSAAGKKPKDEFAVANRREPWDPAAFRGGVTTDRPRSDDMDPTRAQPPTPAFGELAPADPSPRSAVVASLAGTLSRAVALGDHVAARVVHEAIGRLLGLPVAPEGRASSV
ncbi:hypothetical protein [Sorangium sp. So ce1099]|uniref:hypothetical protein n=1 Tax=Sorangium sp. So ce1099 TaxID=3133331 RepID=UPI003F60285C